VITVRVAGWWSDRSRRAGLNAVQISRTAQLPGAEVHAGRRGARVAPVCARRDPHLRAARLALGLGRSTRSTLTTAFRAAGVCSAGVYREYGNDRGEVLMTRDLPAPVDDEALSGLGIYWRPGLRPRRSRRMRAAARGRQAPPYPLQTADIRALSMRIFERTFVITRCCTGSPRAWPVGLVSARSRGSWSVRGNWRSALARPDPGGHRAPGCWRRLSHGIAALLAAFRGTADPLVADTVSSIARPSAGRSICTWRRRSSPTPCGWRSPRRWRRVCTRQAQRARAAANRSAGGVMRRSRARAVVRVAIAGAAACDRSRARRRRPRAEPLYTPHRRRRACAGAGARTSRFRVIHGPHPQSGGVVVCERQSGRPIGAPSILSCVLRFALQPEPALAPPAASAWRTRQIYNGALAITDVSAGRFRFAQKLSREALGLAGGQTVPLRVWVDDWSLEAASAGAAAQESWACAPRSPAMSSSSRCRPWHHRF